MTRCSRCILPDTYPEIRFDDAGVCTYCRAHSPAEYEGRETLEDILARHRGRHEKYDCVVGVSGGRDSSYALWYLARVCGLRVLAYTADHGFVTQAAKDNIARATGILGVDLVREEHDLVKRSVAHSVSSWMQRPSPGMVPMICGGCRLGMFRGLLRVAHEHRISLIVLGAGSAIETGAFKSIYLTSNPGGRLPVINNSPSLSLFFGLLYELARNPAYLSSRSGASVLLQEYLYYFQRGPVQKLLFPQQEMLYLYRYLRWDESEILATIQSELDWTKPASDTSSWRIDCKIDYLKNYMLLGSAGFTEKDEILSRMVREGMLTREEALQRKGHENIVQERLLGELLDEIGVDPGELSTVLGTAVGG
jgi:hypothetical protein